MYQELLGEYAEFYRVDANSLPQLMRFFLKIKKKITYIDLSNPDHEIKA